MTVNDDPSNDEAKQPPPFARQSDAAIYARGQDLIQLASRHFPQETDAVTDNGEWPLIGAALVSRMTGTLKAILTLQPAELEADAGALVRNLFEQLVVLAWLAADPSTERLGEWLKDDLKARLRLASDARSRGIELMTDADRAAMEAQVDALPGNRIALPSLAVAADRYWAGKLPGTDDFKQILSFRALYSTIYRNYSGFTHASHRGIDMVVDDLGSGRLQVRLEGKYGGKGPYGIATIVFAFGLLVAAQSLKWPTESEVYEIVTRYPQA